MRMWKAPPKIMCREHLLGMHVELHMFVGAIKKGNKIDGFIKNDLFEPLSLKYMHDEIVDEMINRGYNHKSPLTQNDFDDMINNMDSRYISHKINTELSLNELISRCPKCRSNFESI